MKTTTITVPTETLADIVGVLVKKLDEAQSKLNSAKDMLSDTEYKRDMLENVTRSLRKENERLRAMLDHEDENWNGKKEKTIKETVRDNIETNCDDF